MEEGSGTHQRVNQVTKELIALKRWAFVEPDTYSAYDSEVRKRVKIWLTSVRHRKAEQAQALVFKYVVPWRVQPREVAVQVGAGASGSA
ncbi:hypothetical protein [Deinococcus radiodurans]|uniref:hypothetical protein n=1 Tax=Deinococcus radiodurans TaxID=1299 RepID=UPI000B101993|nr:hypothetical protein [Deinococcus radiodurans]